MSVSPAGFPHKETALLEETTCALEGAQTHDRLANSTPQC